VLLVAVLSASPASAVPQLPPGGHQTFVWDSLTSVDPGTGGQPVDGWGFHYYEKDGPHDASDFQDMIWIAAGPPGVSCDQQSITGGCWLGGNPIDRCCYITPYVDPVPSCQAQPEFEQSSHVYASVRSWTSPHTGTVVITTPHGNVRKRCASASGDGSMIRIYRNDFMLFEKALSAGDTTGFALNEEIVVNDGDVLWFHNDNDPGMTTEDDGVVFLPYLELTLGSGYDTDPLETSSEADYDPDTQGTNGWTYETYDIGAQTYAQMSACPAKSYWEEDQGCLGTSVCRIWSNEQRPSGSRHAVRAWTAPQDGFVLLRSVGNVRKATSGGDSAVFKALHVGQNGSTVLAQELITTTTGVPLGATAHLRAGDRIELHAMPRTSNPQDARLIVSVSIELFPEGEQPLAVVEMDTGPDISVSSNDAFWFYENRKIFGNLVLDSVPLRIHDSKVELMNTYDTEFAYVFGSCADLTTVRTTIGGGVDDPDADPLHSNFIMWPAGNASWHSTDTIVQYTYSQAILDFGGSTSTLTGTKHINGKEPDFIHVGPGADVELNDSVFGFRLMFPARTTGIVVDLPVNVKFTDTDIGAQFPIQANSDWELSLTDTTVPSWSLAPYGMTNLAPNQSPNVITLDNIESFIAEMAGTNLTGTVTPHIGPLTQDLDTFNVRWHPGQNPTEIRFWAAYFDGPNTSVLLNGPSLIAELFSTGGALVSYVGSTGTFDAETMATTLKSIGSNSRLHLQNCTLGKPGVAGQIRAEGGGYIKIDGAELVGDVSIEAAGAGSVVDIVNLECNGHQVTLVVDGGTINGACN
jgi:hypothetical protein